METEEYQFKDKIEEEFYGWWLNHDLSQYQSMPDEKMVDLLEAAYRAGRMSSTVPPVSGM